MQEIDAAPFHNREEFHGIHGCLQREGVSYFRDSGQSVEGSRQELLKV